MPWIPPLRLPVRNNPSRSSRRSACRLHRNRGSSSTGLNTSTEPWRARQPAKTAAGRSRRRERRGRRSVRFSERRPGPCSLATNPKRYAPDDYHVRRTGIVLHEESTTPQPLARDRRRSPLEQFERASRASRQTGRPFQRVDWRAPPSQAGSWARHMRVRDRIVLDPIVLGTPGGRLPDPDDFRRDRESGAPERALDLSLAGRRVTNVERCIGSDYPAVLAEESRQGLWRKFSRQSAVLEGTGESFEEVGRRKAA